ncbi:MAG TPA: hypothetical protein VGC03_10590 [Acidimicrobiia bacterium]
MRLRLRWVALTIVGVVALTAAISFAPESLPAALPPVRLEGPVVGGNPTQTELVVVPSPSVVLGEPTVTTVTVPPDDGLIGNDSLDSLASADVDSPVPVPPDPEFPDPPVDPGDSADSADPSVDSPDDD